MKKWIFASIVSVIASSAFARVIENEYILRFSSKQNAKRYLKQLHTLSKFDHEVLSTGTRPSVLIRTNKRGVVILSQLKGYDYIEQNRVHVLNKTHRVISRDMPTDPKFKNQWSLRNTRKNFGTPGIDINVVDAWKLTKGHPKVKIAVLDTGIDYNHRDLKDQIWRNTSEIPNNGIDDDNNGYVDDVRGYNFIKNNSKPMDYNGHGSHCAGVIGATHQNKTGIAGIMSRVSLIPVKMLSDHGYTTTALILKAMQYAKSVGAHVVSASWVSDGFSKNHYEALKELADAGIVFVAAAGNDGLDISNFPVYPASYKLPNVISVAAIDYHGRKADFTNFSATRVHVAAPGVRILSTIDRGGYAYLSGSSMAAPHVAGVVGLILSREGLRAIPTIRERLIKSSKKIPRLKGKTQSDGMIDAGRAISAGRNGISL